MKFVLPLKKFKQISLVAAIIFIFSGCPPDHCPPDQNETTPPYYENWILIYGKTTITRNGIPWKYEKDLPPSIAALNEKGDYLGGTYSNNDITWLGNGVYKWYCWIFKDFIPQDSELPCKVYFRVSCWMNGFNLKKITDEFWVENGTSVDLGNINYDIARLYGNLPITINDEAVNNIKGEDFETAIITAYLPDRKWLFETEIQPNGDWSSYIEKPAADTELLCSISAYINGGNFRKTLPNVMYYVDDDDIEINFPGYSDGIILEAITLSGTIKTLIQNGQPEIISVHFFLNGKDNGDQIGNKRVSFLQPNGDGSAEWSLTLPAFSFPQELFVLVFVRGSNGFYQTWSSINITNETDLNNIDLGVFTD